MGRVVGFKPQAAFLPLLRDLRRGRTVDALVARLRGPGGSHSDLLEAADGLRERGAFLEALELIRWFHQKEGLPCRTGEEWRTELGMQSRLYLQAGLWVTGDRDAPPVVPDEPSVTMLASFFAAEPVRMETSSLCRVLREARRVDASILGARAPCEDLTARELSKSGDLLFAGGDYEGAARLWRGAVAFGVDWWGSEFYAAANRLYSAGIDLPAAEEWAEVAVATSLRQAQPAATEMILLARIQLARGKNDEAAVTAQCAAREAIENKRLDLAHGATSFARRSADGTVVARSTPPFESWPE